MRSSSTRTAGWRACISRAIAQCVVARRPSSKPASASTKPPVQMPATRRARALARRRYASAASEAGMATGSITPATIHVSICRRGGAGSVRTLMPNDERTSPPAIE